MKIVRPNGEVARIRLWLRNLYRRFSALSLLVTLVFVAPAVASVNRAPLNKVRLPRIDSRVFENLQRRINEEKETWDEEA